MKLATLWARIGGGLIDLLIVLIISAVILFCWGFLIGLSGKEAYLTEEMQTELWKGRGFLVGLIVDMFYTVGLQASKKQATYGQKAFDLKIIKSNGDAVGVASLIFRYVISLISSILLKIGYLLAVFTKNKQTLHDLVADTIVVVETQAEVQANFNYETLEKNNYEKIEENKKYEKVIDFSLPTNEYKEKYGVNDYDYAKAINEMNGVLADAPVRTDLMNECIATTADVKQAQKKYIYTRAFQISKSINRDAPHIVKADASKLFPQEMMDVVGERQSEKKPKKIEETESFSKWAFTNAGKGLVVGLAIIFGTIGVINLLTNSSVPSADKKEEKSNNKKEDNKPNFFFNDMTYDLKNCEIKNEKNEAIFISKLQTSNDERTGVIHGDKKRTFAGCLLFGRDYTCTDEEDNKKIKIIFDVIYENLTFQKFRNNEINENDLEVEIFCEAFAVYK